MYRYKKTDNIITVKFMYGYTNSIFEAKSTISHEAKALFDQMFVMVVDIIVFISNAAKIGNSELFVFCPFGRMATIIQTMKEQQEAYKYFSRIYIMSCDDRPVIIDSQPWGLVSE